MMETIDPARLTQNLVGKQHTYYTTPFARFASLSAEKTERPKYHSQTVNASWRIAKSLAVTFVISFWLLVLG